MIAAAMMALSAVLFAGAAWGGTVLADWLCAARSAADDGPAPVAILRAHFALAGAGIGVVLAMRGATPLQLSILTLVVLALAGCAAADLACGILPDILTLGPLALLIAFGVAAHNWAPALSAAIVALPFALAALYTRGRGMGWGDVKLAALGGILLGAGNALIAFALASLIAFAFTRRTAALGRPFAFGPYLAASIVGTLATFGGL